MASCKTNLLNRFALDRNGNIAMMFGLFLFPFLLASGVAVDMLRKNNASTIIQEAADGAIIAAARHKLNNPNATEAEVSNLARRFFDSETSRLSGARIKNFSLTFDSATDSFSVEIESDIDATIMALAGHNFLSINTLSVLEVGPPPPIEIALALDNTGSMNEKGKLNDLKSAATDLVETLIPDDAPAENDVKFSLIPFAQYVNLGTSHNAESWLEVPGTAFKGCVGSRDYPNNTTDTGYDLEKIPGINGAPCPDEVLPLTDDKASILSAIDGMDGNGWTYIPSGIVWGWRTLSSGIPFQEGMTLAELNDKGGIKALVVMTDGKNTRAPDYPTHNSKSEVLADQLTKELCDGVKSDKINVYTIAFDVTDPYIRQILQDCASSPSYYFTPDNGSELNSAFEAIAISLRSISLSQ